MKYSQVIFLLFFISRALGQSVSGIVQDTEKPISLVNISLLRSKDSSLQRSAVTDNKGYYQIEKVKPGSYIITASRVGYRLQYSSPIIIESNGGNIQLPTLTLSAVSGQLNEVTVTGKRPFVEQKIDRQVVNVANSIIASGSTALEVLEKAGR